MEDFDDERMEEEDCGSGGGGGEGESSDSSNDSDARDIELERQADELEKEINSNKYQYDKHETLVSLYTELEDYGSLRDAYERFRSVYPLTPTLWMNWIKSEKEIPTSNEDEKRKRIFDLYKLAVEDYSSVILWLDYAQYSLSVCSLEDTKSIINDGIRAIGLHLADGHLLYDMLREIELAILSSKQENTEEWNEQVKKVLECFKRQLSVPLLNTEETYKELNEWSNTLPIDLEGLKAIQSTYKKTLTSLELYKPFEERLSTEKDKDKVYKDYLNALIKDKKKKSSNPVLIMCLFERAVLEHCLNVELWEDYVMFTLTTLGGGTAALKSSKKSVRNCPWHEQLWVLRLKILEKEKQERQEIIQTFEEGMQLIQSSSYGEELWLAFMEYAVRNYGSDGEERGREKIEAVFNQANDYFKIHLLSSGSSWTGSCGLKLADFQARYWACCKEQGQGGFNFNKVQEVYKMYLIKPVNESYQAWKEYLALIQRHGSPDNVRSVFKLAKTKIKDYPLQLIEDWLMYEREKGSLDEVIACLTLRNQIMRNTQTQQQQQALTQEGASSFHKEDGKRMNSTNNSKLNGRKRKQEDEFAENERQQSPSKKFKTEKQNSKSNSRQRHPDRVLTAPSDINPDLTVFVSNLSPDNLEDDLYGMFPNAEKIHIVIDRKGISRRFAYVRFKLQEEAMTALARDREALHGKPVFISQCQVDKTKRESKLKYANSLEKNKLFVKNLPFSFTDQQFEELFSEFNPKSCRLVYNKSNGRSKGFGYVEFKDEFDADKALKATNGKVVVGKDGSGDFKIEVAISAPPPKSLNKFDDNERTNLSSLFVGQTRNSRTKLQTAMTTTSFIPRGVKLASSASNATSVNATRAEKTEETEVKDKEAKEKNKKSNEEFRKMFLKS